MLLLRTIIDYFYFFRLAIYLVKRTLRDQEKHGLDDVETVGCLLFFVFVENNFYLFYIRNYYKI
jgi:hypothetical protein